MAAQPNSWAIISENSTSGRIPPRSETNSSERQRMYRQPPPEKKEKTTPQDDFVSRSLEIRNSSAAGVLEAPRQEEASESDPLAVILSKIDGLLYPDADSGDPPATVHAYRVARAVVESAYGRLFGGRESLAKESGPKVPVPLVTTDERGGIRLSWQHGNRHVRTSFAATEVRRSYLYFESSAGHDVEALQPYTLSDRLVWMLNA